MRFFLIPLLMVLSACGYSTREDFNRVALDVASMEFHCPQQLIQLNSVREEREFFTQRLRAMNYEAAGCGASKLYRASDDKVTNVVQVKELH